MKKLLPLLAVSLLLAACHKNAGGGTGTGSTGASPQASLNACDGDYLGGRPTTDVSGAQVLCHHDFEVLFNPATLDPVYSAEHLTPQQLDGAAPRADSFTPDPLLPAQEQVSTSLYNRSGYDRGHLSPAADFKGDGANMAESFYTSNVAPQVPGLNRDAWEGIEAQTRACAAGERGLYVVTGVWVKPDAPRLNGGPAIPAAYWKVAYTGQGYMAILMPNVSTPKASSYQHFHVTLDQLQQQTGVTVAPGLSLDRSQPGTLCPGAYS